jgi:hypothetical protein
VSETKKLDIDNAVTRELDRLEAEEGHAIEATVTETGVTAEVSTTKKGWRLAAYVRRLWKGETEAGATVKKHW